MIKTQKPTSTLDNKYGKILKYYIIIYYIQTRTRFSRFKRELDISHHAVTR